MQEAFIVDYRRTAIGKYGGALASVRADDLAAHVMAALLERQSSVPPEAIDDVILGCANQAGEDNRNIARMSTLLAGLPATVPGITVNRLCASGLSAVIMAAQMIRSGSADFVIAGGVEQMTRAPFVVPKSDSPFGRTPEIFDTTLGWRFVNPKLKSRYGIDSMGETAENVASQFQVSRADQDRFALGSQKRAALARSSGRLVKEIAPLQIPAKKGSPVSVQEDEFIRPDTTAESLAALKPAFRDGGSVTAGNSSGINDGAAALLIASERAVKSHKLTPLARIREDAAAGVEPRIMGIGPIDAVKKLVQRSGVSLGEVGVIELNEAFASQSLACLRELGVADDDPRVNRNGGAIALGHPLGMSGARLAGTAALELHETGESLAICTMCVGVGQGVALLIERA